MADTRQASAESTPDRRRLLVLGGTALVLLLGGLWWAKYGPYTDKVPAVLGSHDLGDSIVTGGGGSAPAVSLSAGWDFTVAAAAGRYDRGGRRGGAGRGRGHGRADRLTRT